MDNTSCLWYFSNMALSDAIPVFTLFGETEQFPDVVHCEDLSVRAPIHGWRISPHRHARMTQVFLIADGSVEAVVDGTPNTLETGQFLYIPPQKVHEFRFRPGTEGRVVSMPQSVVTSLGPASQEVMAVLSQRLVGQIDPTLGALAQMLARACAESTPFRAQKAVGLAHSLLAQLAEIGLETAPALRVPVDHRMARLDKLIQDHMSEGWTASDYADALSVSTGHLSRLCRDASGRGATAYIEQAIMEEACRLLAFTQMPVSGVGYRLGFADPSYFSKRFRASRGQTPSDYRARFVG